MPPISNGRWDSDAPRRSTGRHAIVPGPVRHRRAVPRVPVQGPLAGRLPLRCLRTRRCLHAQDQDRLRVRGLPQAALALGRHHLRADQDGLGQVVPGDLPGDVQQGRDRRHRAQAAAGPGQLPDRLELAAQAPQGHGSAPTASPWPGASRPTRPTSAARGPASAAGAPPARPWSAGRSRSAAARPAAAVSAGSGSPRWPTPRPRAWKPSSPPVSPSRRP